MQLQTDLEAVERFLKEATQQEASLRQRMTEAASSLQALEESCHQAEVERHHRQRDLEVVSEKRNQLDGEISLISLELAEAETESKTLLEQERSATGALRQVEEKASQLQEAMAKSQERLAEESRRREEGLVRIAEMKTDLSSLEERRAQAERSFTILASNEREKRNSLEAKQEEKREIALREEALAEEKRHLESEKGTFLTEGEALQGRVTDLETRRRALAQRWSQFQETVLPLDRALDDLRQKEHDLELELQEICHERERLLDRLRMTYQVSEVESAPSEAPPDPSLEEEVVSLREKLQRLGPVNLVAIEEHEELKRRHQFLASQKEDLEKARVSLLEAIQKIQRTAKEEFLSTFTQIQGYFKEYYRWLFGGGEAELLLLDEEDVLECGIDILAQPPGKKLQSISLLSGGEKAMTAIALLFAIFKVKPSPFCVLDEIDAPLDESNIARFTSLLSDFLKTSQFIIVTHSKRTITMADVMYGITMQKTGISKVVSVRFKENGNGNGKEARIGLRATATS